jgi:hypothetical protein
MAFVWSAVTLAFETVCPLNSDVQLIATAKSQPAISLPAFKTNRLAGDLDERRRVDGRLSCGCAWRVY